MSNKDKNIYETIYDHGEEISRESEVNSAQIAERLDRVELLIEDLGVAKNVLVQLDRYVTDARSELSSIKQIRFWSVVACYATILLLLGVFVCNLYFTQTWIAGSREYVQGAFLIGTVGGAITLLIVVIKGAFRTISDRHKDDPLPEGLKDAIAAIQPFIDRQH